MVVDQLHSQRCRPFVDQIHACRGCVVLGPADKTDAWQPVDCGGLGRREPQVRIIPEPFQTALELSH